MHTKLQTKPAPSPLERYRQWFNRLSIDTPISATLRALGEPFKALLASNQFRDATWWPLGYSFVTDSEHRFTITVSQCEHLDGLERKAKLWQLVKASDVPYRDWRFFGEALRAFPFELRGYRAHPNGFTAQLQYELNAAKTMNITITATPTDRHQYLLCGNKRVGVPHPKY